MIFEEANRCWPFGAAVDGALLFAVFDAPFDDFTIESSCVNEVGAVVVDGGDWSRVAIASEGCFDLKMKCNTVRSVG